MVYWVVAIDCHSCSTVKKVLNVGDSCCRKKTGCSLTCVVFPLLMWSRETWEMTASTISKVWCFCSSMRWNSFDSMLPSGPVPIGVIKKVQYLYNSTLQKHDMAFEECICLYISHNIQETTWSTKKNKHRCLSFEVWYLKHSSLSF